MQLPAVSESPAYQLIKQIKGLHSQQINKRQL